MTKANLIRFGETKMKGMTAMLFAVSLWCNFAFATDVTPRIRLAPDTQVEELIVTGLNLQYSPRGFITVGLTDVVLVHNFDPEQNAWVFVGTDPGDHVVYVEEIKTDSE